MLTWGISKIYLNPYILSNIYIKKILNIHKINGPHYLNKNTVPPPLHCLCLNGCSPDELQLAGLQFYASTHSRR